MYHLITKRLAIALTLALLPGVSHALLVANGMGDEVRSHGAPTDNSVDLLPRFTVIVPNGPVMYSAAVIGGDAVVNVSVDGGNRLVIDPINGTEGSADIEVRAQDGDNTVSNFFQIHVENDTPTLNPLPVIVQNEGDAISFTASASDPDAPGDTLTYSLGGGAPAGASIDSNSGLFSWTTGEMDDGAYAINIIVTDALGETDDADVDITLNEVNEPPVLGVIGAQSLAEGSALSFTASATDPDSPANTLTFSLDANPTSATIDANTGLFDWTPSEADGPGSFNLTVRVSDGALDDSETITVTVTEDNQAPVLAAIGDQIVNEETLLSFTATATDGDLPANTLTYSLDAGAPAGASITAGGAFTWTPAEADGPGTFPVTIRVTDDGAPTADASETINITVNEINDPPVLTGDVIDLPMNEDDSVAFVEVLAEFDDPDLGDTPPDTLTVFLLPGHDAGLIDVQLSGSGVNVTPEPHQFGSTTVTVGVEDGAGVQVTDTFDVTVASVNDPVTVAGGLANVVAPEDIGSVDVSLVGAFADDDLANGGEMHTVTVSSSDPALIDATNAPLADLAGTINFAVTPDMNGPATITVTAEDDEGSQVSTSFAVTITPETDAPFVDNPISDMNFMEDPGLQVTSLVGVFDDVDIPNGDVLTYTVSTDNPTLIPSAWVAGNALNLDIGPNQNGTATVTVVAEDSTNQTVSDDFIVTVTAVNDDPTQVTPLFNVNAAEDDPTTFTWDLATVFDDVDILTNGDVLTFGMNNSNPALFDVSDITGSVISFHLAPDQNGNATISVQATDSAGATVSDSFDFIIAGVNDFPVASDDTLGPFNEDPGTIVIPVLNNDYLAEGPTTINSAGSGGFSEGTPTIVLDPYDDPISDPNGTVVIVGDEIEYTPKDDFFGVDEFYYTIIDSNGDVSAPARVEITIMEVNDPPIGTQQRTYSIYENETLIVDTSDGVFNGYYDVDGALLDTNGDPVGSPIAAVLTVPPPMGSISFDSSTGAFDFTPPINFTGEISFFYRLFDGIDFSTGTEYEVRVVINSTPSAPPPPAPGTVAITYDISNIPLEQTNSVSPNVMVVLDDSGSMDWNMVVDGTDPDGKVVLDNREARNSGSDSTAYVYLWNLPTNQYGYNNSNGRILPTEEGLDDDNNTDNNHYGVWRARNYKYNSLYYNPNVQYRPWVGHDVNNNDFTDAYINFASNTSAIRLEPRDPTNTFDILAPHSYDSTNVPQWDSNGGRETIGDSPQQVVYIPRYYTTTAEPPLEWNDPHTLVEIRPGNAPFPAANGREDCAADGNPATCSYEEEIQNFANWFQYYRSREYVTKASLGQVIAEVQDIRLGLETLNGSEREPIRDMNELYTEGNKKRFLDDLYDTNSSGGTPLRDALRDTGEIFACNSGSCPILPAPDGMCQQNFALLFSDGYWNGAAGVSGNQDSNSGNDFDGGRYADNRSGTLADTAMYYYKTDLHPALDDEVPLSSADLLGAPSGTFGAGNNTMHQHMKTYTVAFGVDGSIDPTTIPVDPTVPFTWSNPFSGAPQKIDDMMHAALNGRGRFLSASDSVALQSSFEEAFLEFSQASSSTSAAAFNSTSLRDGTLLYRGFFDLRENTGELTATIVNNDGSLAPMPTWRASEMLNPANQLPNNRTLVTSDNLTGDGQPFRHPDLTPDQQIMMSFDEVEWVRGERSQEAGNGGLLRDRPTSNGLLGDIVNSSPVFVGAPGAINRDQAPYPVDDLYSEFAAAQYLRQPIVYVGANDGILHGFDAQTGLELFGYLPNKNMDTSQIYHNDLEDVTSPFYQHKYYVDLTPSINDVYMRPSRAVTGKEWVTLLLGGLGAGGKGYFALNVTEPDSRFTSEANASAAVLWEFTDEDDTYPIDCPGQSESACPGAYLGGGGMLDPAGRPIKDLGVSMSQPTITMSNVSDGGSPATQKWVAVMGNGLNSTAGIAKLFVLFVNDGVDGWDPGDVVKIDTGIGVAPVPLPQAGYPNGLGTPTAVDVDLNGTVDWVYAGDRLGNLYRFDLSDADPDNWTSTRLFTASYTDGGTTTVQPILSKPTVSKHPTEDGFLVTFGTGSHIAREDANSRDIQSIYTIWDRGEVNPATAQPNSKSLRLVEQELSNAVDDSVSPAQTRRILTSNQVDYISESGTPGTYGWYIDLDVLRASTTTSGAPNPDTSGLAPPDPQFPGEKAIRNMIYRDGTIIAATVLPSVGVTSCFGSRPGSILLFDVLTGGNPVQALVDFNNDGYVDDGDLITVGGEDYAAGILFDQDALDGSLVDPSILGGEGDTDFLFISGGNETTSYRILDVNDNRTGRLSWQELD